MPARTRARVLTCTAFLLLLPLTACAEAGGLRDDGAAPATERRATGRSAPPAPQAQTLRPREIPALGPAVRAAVPAEARQAVVVTGEAPDSSRSQVVLYERHPAEGWRPVSDPWPAHNARDGWTDHHVQGDHRSPVGVFGLTDAGGLLDDPGSRLPYDQGSGFVARGTGALGEPLAGSFDYVVAINYNREPGTTPLDWTRPLGAERGGGIWLHVDHDGPTQGCVSLKKDRMRELLRWLDPAKRPVVVMGDAASLGR
ncbi:L,D-transpeptidase family protein [Streptomyces sp. SP18CS02]|uniref:L,D-transpeptidase family protein n=1 Tax=Streptomyces sp. SP18CS02 TaxID=3002531 RepID=UPI002E79D802|nr:L,D-transpeptidase family protein [Streptomyces sp. SP18CS02]MEE1751356.1 L,D-transpeptidase family protein [Streptomyces sp. SP18CS02]